MRKERYIFLSRHELFPSPKAERRELFFRKRDKKTPFPLLLEMRDKMRKGEILLVRKNEDGDGMAFSYYDIPGDMTEERWAGLSSFLAGNASFYDGIYSCPKDKWEKISEIIN